jgi:fucose 4-O-acetylase-like acetyltransferase
MRWIAVAGVALAAGGYGASFLPPIYAETSFWTSSPTFLFLRLGVLLVLVAVAYQLSRVWRWEALEEFGRASLFVYWVHVELVYGVLSAPIHRRLPFPVAVAAFVAFTAAMFGLVRLKNVIQRWRGRPTKSDSYQLVPP